MDNLTFICKIPEGGKGGGGRRKRKEIMCLVIFLDKIKKINANI